QSAVAGRGGAGVQGDGQDPAQRRDRGDPRRGLQPYRGRQSCGSDAVISRHYMDFTGCGNTLNMVHPHSIQLLMDSLRYWVTEMHVDGFRFDLASALARELKDVDQLGAFFATIYQDPTLAPE